MQKAPTTMTTRMAMPKCATPASSAANPPRRSSRMIVNTQHQHQLDDEMPSSLAPSKESIIGKSLGRMKMRMKLTMLEMKGAFRLLWIEIPVFPALLEEEIPEQHLETETRTTKRPKHPAKTKNLLVSRDDDDLASILYIGVALASLFPSR